jgi:hypothetical protein
MAFVRGYDWEGDEKPAAMVFLTSKLRIRLTDPEKNPVANGRCRVTGEPETIYACDEHGIAEIPLRDRTLKSILIEWESGEAGSQEDSERFPWSNAFEVDIRSAQDADCERRLAHLGFFGDSLSVRVTAYQNHLDLPATGKIADIRDQLVAWHDGGDHPGSAPA